MKTLSDALDRGTAVGIKYIDRQGLYSERVIIPKKIYKNKYVYVDAYCELDKDVRVFRLSRMRICKTRLNFYDNATNSYVGQEWSGGVWRS